MRLPILLLFIGVILLPARATEYVVNGDFAEGMGHWYGDSRTPADYAHDTGLISPDAFNNKGIIMPLKTRNWVRIAQDFRGKVAGGILTISYQCSGDCKFSDKAEDYANIPNSIKFNGWQPFGITTGRWIVFISDFASAHGSYYPIEPDTSGGVITVHLKVSKLTPHENKTVLVAFPPGTGTVVLTHVSFDDGDASAAPADPNAIPKL